MFRKLVVSMYIDDEKAIKKGKGTIDYLQQILGRNGICLDDARILDEDDEEDSLAIKLVDMIMNNEERQ